MKKAYFCIDGFSFKRINDYYKYEHKRRSRIKIASLETYLRYEIERRVCIPSSSENLSFEKHFYYPSPNPRSYFYRREIGDAILKFENNLSTSGYTVHYSQNTPTFEAKPNENILADSIMAMQFKKIDFFILLSTQGQHTNIFQKLRLCQIPGILVGWDSFCTNSSGEKSLWRTDKTLLNNANIYCPLEKTLNLKNGEHPIVEIMFENFFNVSHQHKQRYLALCHC